MPLSYYTYSGRQPGPWSTGPGVSTAGTMFPTGVGIGGVLPSSSGPGVSTAGMTFGGAPSAPQPQQPLRAPAPPAQPTAGAQPAPQAAFSFDYSGDPILRKIQALNAADIASARAQADQKRWELLLGFGNQELARGMFADDPRVGAVSADPDKSLSILARLARGYRENQTGLNEALNKQNLFYSTHRGKQLGELAHQRQTQEFDATAAVNEALGGIGASLAQFIREAKLREMEAEAAAQDRAIQEFLQMGLSTGGPDTTAAGPAAPPTQPKPQLGLALESRLRRQMGLPGGGGL